METVGNAVLPRDQNFEQAVMIDLKQMHHGLSCSPPECICIHIEELLAAVGRRITCLRHEGVPSELLLWSAVRDVSSESSRLMAEWPEYHTRTCDLLYGFLLVEVEHQVTENKQLWADANHLALAEAHKWIRDFRLIEVEGRK